MRPRRMAAVTVVLAVGAAMAASVAAQAHPQVQRRDLALAANSGIHKIKHIIFITQENRSFDNYFGTFPGAVGIPKGVCAPDPRNGGCRRPWVDHHNSNGNNPHAEEPFKIDYNGGKMNGFVRAAEEKLCKPKPAKCHPDVMGYHVASDIPNYWRYAKNFVLQDHFFEAAGSWSLPSHLYQVSAWSGKCRRTGVARSCYGTDMPPERLPNRQTPFAWTDITWLLHRHGVRWAYYLDHGAVTVSLGNPTGTSIHFNPLPGFTDVHKDGQLGSMRPLKVFYRAAKAGTLPKVSWVAPDFRDSEHGPARPGLEVVRDLRQLGRLGRLLRQLEAADHRSPGVRHQGARLGDQPVRQARLRGPPDPVDRRVPEVHRGRLPRRRAAEPAYRRPLRSAARCPRGLGQAGQPDQ